MLRRLAVFTLVLATASSTSALTATAAGQAARRQAALCFGQVPTISGSPGMKDLTGTGGPDVVATNGSRNVNARGGDDLVCITGPAVLKDGEPALAHLATGPGSDRVDASQAKSPFVTALGGGSDEYVGGAQADRVWAGEPFARDRAPDEIRTLGGRDVVFSGGGDDVVDLGRHADELYVGGEAEGAVLSGGDGDDTLGFDLVSVDGQHSWTVNNRTEQLIRDGTGVAGWDSFIGFTVAARGPVAFRGSEAAETLRISRSPGHGLFSWQPRRWPLDVRMGGGDDVFRFTGGASDSRIDGGGGTDRLEYEVSFSELVPETNVLLDLSLGILRDRLPTGDISRRVVNVEDAALSNTKGMTTIVGSDGANTLSTGFGSGSTKPSTIAGRGGDDRLVGGLGNDLLVGGPGRDVARGDLGFDRCETEVRTGCEG
jgi:Ca2+-binding RTX toxin-like protein